MLLPFLGRNSVLLLDEQPHMAQRKLMLPSFHGERMRRYGQTMTEVTEREVGLAGRRRRGLAAHAGDHARGGDAHRVRRDRHHASPAAWDALREVLSWASDPRRMAMIAVMGPHRLSRVRAFRRVIDPADELLFEEIRRRRAAPDLEERDDVLSMLLQARDEDGSAMSDQELRDELITLLVAGHETTATSLAWTIERWCATPRACGAGRRSRRARTPTSTPW